MTEKSLSTTMKYIFIVSLLVVTASAFAENPTDTHGTNSLGEKITMYLEMTDNGYRHDVEVMLNGQRKVFENQPCKPAGPNYSEGSFSCPKEGTSPLAGATYEYVRELTNCRGLLFVCKSGCGISAPSEMIKDLDECGELGKHYWPACHPNNHENVGTTGRDDVMLRNEPEINALVSERLHSKVKVKILEKRPECITIDHEKGQWIKVEITEGKLTESGWIFDAVIEYQPASGKQKPVR